MEEKKPTQNDLLFNLLSDEKPHNTKEIMEKVYGNEHLGLARVGARVYDIKRKPERYGAVEFNGWKDKQNPSIYWYQMLFIRQQSVAFNEPVYRPEVLQRLEAKKQEKLL